MKRARKFFPILLPLLLFLLPACGADTDPESVLNYGLTLSPSGIDPHLNASSELGIPLNSVYDTLVFYDAEAEKYVPGLASNWEISDDGTKYTFFLREDVVFHDNSRFDADAVKANIDYILNPNHNSQKAAGMLGPLSEVEVVDDFTVVFHLEAPFAPLMNSLSQVYIGMASPKALEAWGPAEYQFHQVGTGPYTFVEYVPNSHIILEKNTDYAWAPSIFKSEQASIDRIEFGFYEDPATRLIALKGGEVDIIGEVPPHDVERLVAEDGFELYPVPVPGQPLHYFFNTKTSPTDDPRVREALLISVNRTRILETVFGSYSPLAEGPLTAQPFDLDVEEIEYSPALAADLLDEAGWARNSADEMRSKDGNPLRLKIIAPTWGYNPETAQLMKADWEALGAQVELEIAPGFGQLKEKQDEGDYHAIGLNFFGTDPDLIRPFYTSDGFFNWHGYSSDVLDQQLEEGVRKSNSQVRHEVYSQIATTIQTEALLLPIRDYVNLVVANERVVGLHYSSEGWFPHLIDLQLR